MRLDAVADGDDDVEVEIFDITTDGLATFGLNCCKFCNSSLGMQFALLVDVLDMPGNNRFIPLEQGAHLTER